MSTGTQPAKKSVGTEVTKQAPPETVITYVPLGENVEISLTVSRVKQFLCTPTKSGVYPTDSQVVQFMMMCRAQSLNPWVRDAHLVGYDGRDGAQFSLITAHQAFLKRAEASKEFNGLESGVIVMSGDSLKERQGDLVLPGETLIGGWARAHRKDRDIASYDALNLQTFDTKRSRWAADPAGMIVKCAEASALRKAFPSTLAAMYCREEMDRAREHAESDAPADTRTKTEKLTEMLKATTIGHVDLPERHESTPTVSDQPQTTPEPSREPEQRQEATETPQKEPDKAEAPPRDGTNSRADNLSRRIHLATAAKELAQLSLEVGESLADGGLSQHEADALSGLIKDKMPK